MFQSDGLTLSMNFLSTAVTFLHVTYEGDRACWVEAQSGDRIGLLTFEFWLGDTFEAEGRALFWLFLARGFFLHK